jgi:hypothetical protein
MTRIMDRDVQAVRAIHAILAPGERLVWQARPETSRPLTEAQRSTATVATILGAALLLLAFLYPDDAGGWRYALLAPALLATAVAGILAALGSRWLFGLLRDNAYAITDRRAIVVRCGRSGPVVTEFGPAHIVYVHVYPIADGIADVIFREGPNLGGLPDPKRRQGRELNPIGFKMIRDAEAAGAALWALREAGPLASTTPAWEPSPDGKA